MTTTMTINLTAPAAVNAYNELLKQNAPADKLTKAEAAITEANKADNKAAKEARVKELLNIRATQGETAFFDAYLGDRTYPGHAAVQDKDDKTYELKDRAMVLRFEDMEKVFKEGAADSGASLARDPRYKKFVGLLQWNLARSTAKELEIGKAQVLTDKQLETMRKEPELKVFTGATNGALLSQIQTIAEAILPEGYAPAMNSADRKYIQLASVQKVKRGTVTGAKDSSVLDELLTAVIIRKNGLHYDFQSKSAGMKMKKSDLTPKQEEVLAKAKDPAPTAVEAAKNARKEMAAAKAQPAA